MRGKLSGQSSFSQPYLQPTRSERFTFSCRVCDPLGFLKLVADSLDSIFGDNVSDNGIGNCKYFCCGIHFQRAFPYEIMNYRLISNVHWKIPTNFLI